MPEPNISPFYEKGKLYQIPCGDLQSDPDQPRKFFDEASLRDLATSIKDHGVLQPVLFRQDNAGKLFIVAGERRLKAAIMAGLKTIPALLVEGQHAEIALVENVLRHDLTQIELAEALDRMKEHGYNQDQLANIIQKAKSTLSEILSINRLPLEIRDECRKNSRISRQVLIDIAKKKTPKGMLTAYEKYKEQVAVDADEKQKTDRKQKQRKTWHHKFKSTLHDLERLFTDNYIETLDTAALAELANNIEELKTITESFLQKIKPTSVDETKPAVTAKPKKIGSKPPLSLSVDLFNDDKS